MAKKALARRQTPSARVRTVRRSLVLLPLSGGPARWAVVGTARPATAQFGCPGSRRSSWRACCWCSAPRLAVSPTSSLAPLHELCRATHLQGEASHSFGAPRQDPLPLGLSNHARRALPLGTHGGDAGLVGKVDGAPSPVVSGIGHPGASLLRPSGPLTSGGVFGRGVSAQTTPTCPTTSFVFRRFAAQAACDIAPQSQSELANVFSGCAVWRRRRDGTLQISGLQKPGLCVIHIDGVDDDWVWCCAFRGKAGRLRAARLFGGFGGLRWFILEAPIVLVLTEQDLSEVADLPDVRSWRAAPARAKQRKTSGTQAPAALRGSPQRAFSRAAC